MKINILLVLVFFLTNSCDKPKELVENVEHQTTININNLEEWKSGKYSDICDSISLVKLETTNESIIGRIDKLITFNDNYYILDQAQRKAVLKFNKNGKFVCTIGKLGKGPGEYMEPNDIAINYFSKELAIWCNTTQKIIFYDLEGNYKRAIKLNYFVKSFAFIEKNKIALYLDIDSYENANHLFNLLIIDNKGKEIARAFDSKNREEPSKGGFSFFSQIPELNTSILYGYSNDIYLIKNNKLTREYSINFGKHDIPSELLSLSNNEFTTKLRKSNYGFVSSHLNLTNFLIINFVYKNKIYNCFFSKKTGKFFYANLWLNDVSGILSGNLYTANNNNNVISIFETSNIEYLKKTLTKNIDIKNIKRTSLDYAKKKIPDKKILKQLSRHVNSTSIDFSKEDIDFLMTINPTDNPILIIQHVKEF